MARDRLGY